VAEEIRAEMVANVMSVVVAPGATGIRRDTLVILESMKMEIPVITECPDSDLGGGVEATWCRA